MKNSCHTCNKKIRRYQLIIHQCQLMIHQFWLWSTDMNLRSHMRSQNIRWYQLIIIHRHRLKSTDMNLQVILEIRFFSNTSQQLTRAVFFVLEPFFYGCQILNAHEIILRLHILIINSSQGKKKEKKKRTSWVATDWFYFITGFLSFILY